MKLYYYSQSEEKADVQGHPVQFLLAKKEHVYDKLFDIFVNAIYQRTINPPLSAEINHLAQVHCKILISAVFEKRPIRVDDLTWRKYLGQTDIKAGSLDNRGSLLLRILRGQYPR